MSDNDIRWKQRFYNFSKAFALLAEIPNYNHEDLSQLEKEGAIQRFEYTFELCWKTLKDKLEFDGIILETITPRSTFRKAFEVGYITNPATWFDIVDSRNLMSHTYNLETANQIFDKIRTTYIPEMNKLYNRLLEEINGS
ncbi:MAG: nucleotidyltransferase substrate binding protein [Spirochaetales bacterium]|nr:nucleotidyltransferase substrate binding protein [Spirochaetales bacterium]